MVVATCVAFVISHRVDLKNRLNLLKFGGFGCIHKNGTVLEKKSVLLKNWNRPPAHHSPRHTSTTWFLEPAAGAARIPSAFLGSSGFRDQSMAPGGEGRKKVIIDTDPGIGPYCFLLLLLY
jgi:hypothetical protein